LDSGSAPTMKIAAFCLCQSAAALHPGIYLPRSTQSVGRSNLIVAADVAAFDFSTLDPKAIVGGAAGVIGAAVAFKQSEGASAPASASNTAPPPPTPKKARSPASFKPIGGKTGPHRMAGTMPPPPVREVWTPPPGWKPPTKPVVSWYDMGIRLTPSAPEPAPPPPSSPQAPRPFEEMMKSFQAFFKGGESAAAAASSPKRGPWKAIGGTAGPHRMSGTMPPPPKRELWIPPPGWEAPSPPPRPMVASWYDSGQRL